MNVYLGESYKEVEYIQSSGTQYINTGVYPNPDYTTEVKFQNTSFSTFNTFFGCRNGSDARYYARNDVYDYFRVNRSYNTNSGYEQYTASTPRDYNEHTIKMNRYLYVDGTLVKTFSAMQSSTAFPYSIYLFALNSNGTAADFMIGKIFYCKIWNDNGTLIRDMVPCYRVSDNVIGLFDKVNNKFYANAGTGTFTKGSNVGTFQPELKNAYIGEYTGGLPNTYQKVEYIQSSGTQHIDTGHKHTANTKFEIKFNYQSQSASWNMICGSRSSYSTSDCMNLYLHNSNYIAYGVGGKYNDNFYSSSVNTDYVVSLSKTNITINGSSTSLSTSLTNYSYNDWIFGVNSNNSQVEGKAKMKLYYFKIYEGTTLVRDFVPCYRKSDNAIGLYDLANSVFYTNAGSGTFTKGPDAN